MNRKKILFAVIYISSIVILFSGCTPLVLEQNPLPDRKAAIFANKALFFNQHIISSRGKGWVRVETEKNLNIFKIAWAATFPDKLRLSFFISANPIETIISSDGKITFISHTEKHARRSYNSTDPDLETYLNVPIKLSEMISLLLGRLPVRKFDQAFFESSDPSRSTLSLTKKWQHSKQYLHFDNRNLMTDLRLTDGSNRLVYNISIKAYKKYKTDTIPVKLEIYDDNNRSVNLEITDFTANPDIKETVFQLTQ